MSKKKAMFFKGASGGGSPVIADYTTAFNSTTTEGTVTLTLPTTTVTGDLLIIIAMSDQKNINGTDLYNQTNLDTEGFTFAVADGNPTVDACYGVYWKYADGTETATIDVTQNFTGYYSAGAYLRITGSVGVNPINILGSKVLSTVNPTTITQVTTTADNCLALAILTIDGGASRTFTLSGSTGWIDPIVLGDTGTATAGGMFSTKEIPTAGLTGDLIVTSSLTDGTASIQIGIQ